MTRVYLQDTELTGGTGSNISAEDLRKYFEPYSDDDNEYPYLLYGNVNGDTFQYIFYAGQKAEFDPSLPPGALFEYLPDDKTDPNFGKCFLNMGHGLVDVTGLLSVSWNDIIDKPDFDSYQTADQVSQTIQDALSDLDISGFLKRIDLTESEYAALETKDHDTVYVIEADEEMVDITITFNFVDSEEPYPNIEIDLYNEDDFQSIEEGSKIPIYQTTSNDYANDITGTWPKYESGKEIAYQIYARTPPGYRELTIDKFADGSTISFTITANKLGELPAW